MLGRNYSAKILVKMETRNEWDTESIWQTQPHSTLAALASGYVNTKAYSLLGRSNRLFRSQRTGIRMNSSWKDKSQLLPQQGNNKGEEVP